MSQAAADPADRTLWVVHIGNDDKVAVRALDEGFICIGWTAMGDLSQFPTRDSARDAMAKTYPSWSAKKVSSSFGQVHRFAHVMQKGELVVFPVRVTGEIAIGRISGPYRFASDDTELVEKDYHNVRPVEWLNKSVPRTAFSQAALHSFGSFLSISTSDDYLEEVLAVLAGDSSVPAPEPALESGDEVEPDEAGQLHETAQQETTDYLLKRWQRTGYEFEEVVAAVLRAMGYTARTTSKSGDHGVDVVAHPDPLGIHPPIVKVQVKSGASKIGEPEVSQLRGCLRDGERGVFVSLGRFTTPAQDAARHNGITLVDAQQFVELFLDHYDRLEPEWRARFQLKQVFVPVR